MRTHIERWARVAQEHPHWDERNRVIAALIEPGSSVVDVGAGNMTLRDLAPVAVYVPVDCVASCPETVIADFNEGVIPHLVGQFDYAVLSGLLEHIDDPETALRAASSWATYTIFSYCITETVPPGPMREDFRNHLSALDVLQMLARLGLTCWMPTTWSGQAIFMCWPARGARP